MATARAGYLIGDLVGGIALAGIDDGIRAAAKFRAGGYGARAAGLGALHGFGHATVQSAFAGAGYYAGYQATGTFEGGLMGANIGSMVGGVVAAKLVACFVEGTRVKTLEGFKFVEHCVEQRDLLASRTDDDANAPIEYKPIEEVFIRHTHVMYVSVAGRRIGTTAEHPIYIRDKGWIPAGQLEIGDLTNSDDGTWHPVTALDFTGEIKKVYNFRIADHHTYFVGDDDWGFSVWVHNSYNAFRSVIKGHGVSAPEAYQLAKAGDWNAFQRLLGGRGFSSRHIQKAFKLANGAAAGAAEEFQALTTAVNARLASNLSLASQPGILSPWELAASAVSKKVAIASYGKAVEKLAAQDVALSPVLRARFQHVGGKNNPDFVGIGKYAGLEFDITTELARAEHLSRPRYGAGLQIATYLRPKGF